MSDDNNGPLAGIRKQQAKLTGWGVVKAVISGDSVVLMGACGPNQMPPEKQVTLSGVQAPRLARSKNAEDEPFAWASREFLRKMIIGQQVQFTVNYSHEASGREYGDLMFQGQNLAYLMVQAGWASVKPPPEGSKVHPEKELLMEAEQAAKEAGIGIWTKTTNEKQFVRKIDWAPKQKMFNEWKGKHVAAVVDKVRDGSSLRLDVPGANGVHYMLTLNLAGVLCPRTPMPHDYLMSQYDQKKRNDPTFSEAPPEVKEPEPFALEAAEYVDRRLLNRDVQVLVQGCDKFDNFFGTVLVPKGNISLKLLENGLGKLVPWSASLTPEKDRMTEIERLAKASRIRLWKTYDPAADGEEATLAAASAKAYNAKVVQIASCDTVVVSKDGGEEVKLSLASIRGPRMGRRGEAGEPWAKEAFEFLRTSLVGRKVRVMPEYTRSPPPASSDTEDRQYATIFLNDKNISEVLLDKGFAKLLNHRVDEPRSLFYDKLMVAEMSASSANRGVHGKPPPASRTVDLTERFGGRSKPGEAKNTEQEEKKTALAAKAKQFLPFLQREKRMDAVVEHVFSASRFKVEVPKENVVLALVLGGVQVPRSRDESGNADPLADRATQWVKSRVLQHNVKIEVEALDRADNFIGALFINGLNLAVALLKEGYAKTFGYSADKSPFKDELYAAEAEAKAARIGVWENYVEPTAEELAAAAQENEEEVPTTDASYDARLTEIESAGSFYIHRLGDKNLETVNAGMADFVPPPEDKAWVPTKGSVVAGCYTDGQWYRVKNEGATAHGTYRVNFLDFGNRDELELSQMRPLDQKLASIPPCARPCLLAGVKPPSAVSDYFEDAAVAFNDLAWDRTLKVNVELRDRSNKLHVTLSDPQFPDTTLNKELVKAGWVRVHPKPEFKLKQYARSLLELEEIAKRGRFHIWEYGVVSDEDSDNDAGRPGVARTKVKQEELKGKK